MIHTSRYAHIWSWRVPRIWRRLRPTDCATLLERGEKRNDRWRVCGHDVSRGSGAVFDRPTARTSSEKKEKRWFESRRHDDVDDERLRLRRLKDEARNIAGDENKDRRVDYNNSLPAGCLERKRSSFPAGWSHREAASGHHGPPPVGSPEWQPRLQRQQ